MHIKRVVLFLLLASLFLDSGGRPICNSEIRPGKDLAVFFAVEKYQSDKLGNLQNPVKNARDIAAVLSSRFGFDTLVLVNPTQEQITQKIDELTEQYLRNEDGHHPSDGQLFLFFSGHGISEDENGYFLPSDADPDKPWNTSIPYVIWRPKIDKINCQHILVAIDACYSVRFDPDWRNKTDGQFKRPGEMSDSQKALANFEAYKARVFFTSDNKENQTPDKSNFAKKLLEGLRETNMTDGFLTSKQLFANYVENATPTPRAGTFGNDEPGSAFLFYNISEPVKKNPKDIADDRTFKKAQNRNSIDAYQDYLDIFPEGSHKAECLLAIEELKKGSGIITNLVCKDKVTIELAANNEVELVASQVLLGDGYGSDAFYVVEVDKTLPYGNGPWVPAILDGSDLGKVFPIRVIQTTTGNKCWGNVYIYDAEGGFISLLESTMVDVAGGTFEMGCTSEQKDCQSDENPVHTVTLDDFYIGRYEVTQRLWRQVMKKDPAELTFKGCDDCPVEKVSWEDVQEFLLTLNSMTKSDKTFRLPTEAEWEYAARGKGQAILFGNGKDIADPKVINFDGHLTPKPYSKKGNERERTVMVGSLKSPNTLGLHDMSGNVWEWCSDWYDVDYYKNSPSSNPMGPISGIGRVIRGGSWSNGPQNCRVADRSSSPPNFRGASVGFRLARSK